MGIFDRFRNKPVSYILQIKTGKNKFKDVSTYNAQDFSTPPKIDTLDDVEDKTKNHRLMAKYQSGPLKQIDTYKGIKTSTGAPKKVNWDAMEKGIEDAIEPFVRIGGIVKTLNSALAELKGDGLGAEEVRHIIREEMGGRGGGDGDFWNNVTPPTWTWFFHPAMRGAQKDLLTDVGDMIAGVGKKIMFPNNKQSTTPTTTPPPTENLFNDILTDELSKVQQEEKTPKPPEPSSLAVIKDKGEENVA